MQAWHNSGTPLRALVHQAKQQVPVAHMPTYTYEPHWKCILECACRTFTAHGNSKSAAQEDATLESMNWHKDFLPTRAIPKAYAPIVCTAHKEVLDTIYAVQVEPNAAVSRVFAPNNQNSEDPDVACAWYNIAKGLSCCANPVKAADAVYARAHLPLSRYSGVTLRTMLCLARQSRLPFNVASIMTRAVMHGTQVLMVPWLWESDDHPVLLYLPPVDNHTAHWELVNLPLHRSIPLPPGPIDHSFAVAASYNRNLPWGNGAVLSAFIFATTRAYLLEIDTDPNVQYNPGRVYTDWDDFHAAIEPYLFGDDLGTEVHRDQRAMIEAKEADRRIEIMEDEQYRWDAFEKALDKYMDVHMDLQALLQTQANEYADLEDEEDDAYCELYRDIFLESHRILKDCLARQFIPTSLPCLSVNEPYVAFRLMDGSYMTQETATAAALTRNDLLNMLCGQYVPKPTVLRFHQKVANFLSNWLFQDEARPSDWIYSVGANPPVGRADHWCGAGACTANDLNIVHALRIAGTKVCNCSYTYKGRCIHYWIWAPLFYWPWYRTQTISTVFTDEALPIDYCVPVVRPGWRPFSMALDDTVSFGLQCGEAGSLTGLDHRVTSSNSLWPCASPFHTFTPELVERTDQLAFGFSGESAPRVKCLQAKYNPEHYIRSRMPLWYAAFALMVLLLAYLQLAIYFVEEEALCTWPDYTFPLPKDSRIVDFWWHFLYASAKVLLLETLASVLLCVADFGTVPLTYTLKVLCLPVIACIFALSMMVIRPYMSHHWFGWREPWKRRYPRHLVSFLLKEVHIPEKARILPQAMALWDGKSDLETVLHSAAVRELQRSAWKGEDDLTHSRCSLMVTPDDIRALANLLKLTDRGDVPAFGRMRRARQDITDWAGNRRKNVRCARPGCTSAPVGKWKWRHGLCPACYASLSNNSSCEATAWREGALCGGKTVAFEGFVPILETKATLPITRFNACPKILQLPGNETAPKQVGARELYYSDHEHTPRVAGFLAGYGIVVPPTVFPKTFLANIRTLVCRVFKENPIAPKPGVLTTLFGKAREVENVLGKFSLLKIMPPTKLEWLQHFPANRRKVFEHLLVDLLETGCPVALKPPKFKLIVKREWTAAAVPSDSEAAHYITDADVQEWRMSILNGGKFTIPCVPVRAFFEPMRCGKPRAVNGPEDSTHLHAGPATFEMTHQLKNHWHHLNHIFYASVSPSLLDEWLNLNCHRGFVVWCDYTMFDCTHSRESWQNLETLYDQILDDGWEGKEAAFKVFDLWRAPKGTALARNGQILRKVKYKGGIMNASGRDDTALANALLNGVVMSSALAAAYFSVQLEDLSVQQWREFSHLAALAVVGDDSLCFCPTTRSDGNPWSETDMRAVSDNIAKSGFIAKLGWSHRVVDAIFLGNRPYKVAGRWYWGPTLGRRLFKHHCCISPDANPIAWLHGVARMEATAFPFVPLLGAMAKRTCELLAGKKVAELPIPSYKLDWTKREVPAAPDVSTYRACADAYTTDGFVMTERMLHQAEAEITAVDSLPVYLGHPAFSVALFVDTL